jgi:hypothetical protein
MPQQVRLEPHIARSYACADVEDVCHANTTWDVSASSLAVAITSQFDPATRSRRACRDVSVPHFRRRHAGLSFGHSGSRHSSRRTGISWSFGNDQFDSGRFFEPVSLPLDQAFIRPRRLSQARAASLGWVVPMPSASIPAERRVTDRQSRRVEALLPSVRFACPAVSTRHLFRQVRSSRSSVSAGCRSELQADWQRQSKKQ